MQLHQQQLTPELDGFLTTSVVIPPDSEIVTNFSVSGIRPNGCALFEPSRCLTEEYGIVVGHTLGDASSCSGSLLIVNPNAEVVVLPSCTCIGKLVPVAAISVALEDPGFPKDGCSAGVLGRNRRRLSPVVGSSNIVGNRTPPPPPPSRGRSAPPRRKR